MAWKVLITARTLRDVGAAALDLMRRNGCELVHSSSCSPLTAPELERHLDGVDAVLAGMDPFSAAVLNSPNAARLKIISRWGVGYDAVDVPAATARGIMVAYTPGLLDETVADYAFALMLALARRLHEAHAQTSQGTFQCLWGLDIFGKTLGIIGCGRIGRAFARRARGFNLRLLGCDIHPHPEAEQLGIHFVSLQQLLDQSDFVSLHAALTPQSRGLIGEAELRRMKPTACLINTGRGALVDETALLSALQEGRIFGAALDVYTTEPLPKNHPLLSAPNVLLTPHQASFARDTGERVSLVAAQAIVDCMQGRKPAHLVDPTVLQSPKLRIAG